MSLPIALVTAAAARELDDDLTPLSAALDAIGTDFSIIDWDDAVIDWSRFGLVVLRSTWDYTMRLGEFLSWAGHVAGVTTLLNPIDVIRWNTDKHYLAELDRAGVPVVPSFFVEPTDNAPEALDRFLSAHANAAEFVVKPSVGAGSRDAQRYGRDDIVSALTHVQRLCEAKRSVLLQPYFSDVDTNGETALIFFEGEFSHAIRKGPLLQRGTGPTRALFAAEAISARTPTADEQAVAQRVLNAIPFAQPLLYARVDLIRAADGSPRVLETELVEPSLFFDHAPGSADRYARALRARNRT
ncbi:MAG: hypothetical protein ABI451_12310 [Dokdonella sp.]